MSTLFWTEYRDKRFYTTREIYITALPLLNRSGLAHWCFDNPHMQVLRGCDELARVYLIARAYDLYFYGQQVADATFPAPHLQGASATVAALGRAIEEIVVEQSFRITSQREWEFDRKMVRINGAATLARVYTPPETLPARVPNAAERTALKNACLAALSGSSVLTVVHWT